MARKTRAVLYHLSMAGRKAARVFGDRASAFISGPQVYKATVVKKRRTRMMARDESWKEFMSRSCLQLSSSTILRL